VRLPHVDPAALPSWRDAPGPRDGVRLYDLDAGERLPVMAELDAHPDAADAPSLLIRPLRTLTPGHRVAVVITTDVAARPERFDVLARGRRVPGFDDRDHVLVLLDELEALGEDPDAVALAWDFPVGDGTAPLQTALSQLEPPGTWRFTNVREASAGDRVAP